MSNLVSVRVSNSYSMDSSIDEQVISSKYSRNLKEDEFYANQNNTIWFNDEPTEFKRDIKDLKQHKLKREIKKTISDKIEKIEKFHKKHNGRKLQKNRNLFFNGIITFGNETQNLSREEMENVNQDELDKSRHNRVKKILESLNLKGNDYILVKHKDEQQIHYHFDFIGYDLKEKKSVRKKMNQKKMIEFQDIAGERFNDLGFERGKPKSERVREYCKEHNIDYQKLSSKQKYDILVITRTKHQSLKNYHEKMKNDVYTKQQKHIKLIEVDETLTNLHNQIINKELSLEQIQQLQKQNENKTIKTYLNYRYRLMNEKNSFEAQNKRYNHLVKKYEKMDIELKKTTLKLEKSEKRLNNINKVESSNININVTTKHNDNIKVNEVNYDDIDKKFKDKKLAQQKQKEQESNLKKEQSYDLNKEIDNALNKSEKIYIDENGDEWSEEDWEFINTPSYIPSKNEVRNIAGKGVKFPEIKKESKKSTYSYGGYKLLGD